jgi:hypothetical protein
MWDSWSSTVEFTAEVSLSQIEAVKNGKNNLKCNLEHFVLMASENLEH